MIVQPIILAQRIVTLLFIRLKFDDFWAIGAVDSSQHHYRSVWYTY